MSAPRLSPARLFPLLALAALAPFVACTRATPGYCTRDQDCGDAGATCNTNINTCIMADAANGTGGAGAGGAGGSPGSDGAAGDTGGDHPATDGPSSDTGADVYHGCVDNHGCTDPSKPACQIDGGVCVGCLSSTDCTTAGARACDTAATKCVECVGNSDCTDPTRPVCDNQACRGCKVDSECATAGAAAGPGVCMFHLDGHCATDSETVYVAPGNAACSDSAANAGTSLVPFCTSQAGIDATALPAAPPPVDAGGGTSDAGNTDGGGADAGAGIDGGAGSGIPASPRPLVVMRGPSLTEWSFNISDRTLTVVGQSSATVSPGGHIGVHVSAGTVYVRSLHVTGGQTSQPGVVADGGELHLDRCIVDYNGAGGVQVDGAGFEITNSVLANNGVGTFNGSTSWSGALLGVVPAGKPATFLNNTVVNNMAPGVVCTQGNSHNVLGSILSQNTVAQSLVCNYAVCCTGDPGLNASYHLTATSPCKDQLPANMSTAYDIDGNPRPYNTLSDCGADEYVVP